MYDVIIMGGGIAGQTAAIYAARKRMNFLLLAKDLGGQFFRAGEILNYPGIVKTTGPELGQIMEEQLKFNNVKPISGEEVQSIKKGKNGFRVMTNKDKYEGKSVIVATGARPRKLNVPGEETFAKKGLTYCSICDGPLFSGKDIAIVGGGNSALQAVEFTYKFAKKIYIINKNEKFKCHEYMLDKAKKYPNVEFINNANLQEIFGDKFITGIKYEQGGKSHKLNVQGVVVEIGRVPNTDFVKGLVEMDKNGHIIIDIHGQTTQPGIFAAGDSTAGHEYQLIISAGQGCAALLSAARYLANPRY